MFQQIKQIDMKFEAIDKKLREVGLRFNKPTIERKKINGILNLELKLIIKIVWMGVYIIFIEIVNTPNIIV